MLLHHCTWPDVAAYLERSRGIVIPMGSTEQHGPNGIIGIIGTNALCAEVIARDAGQRLLDTAAEEAAADYLAFLQESAAGTEPDS